MISSMLPVNLEEIVYDITWNVWTHVSRVYDENRITPVRILAHFLFVAILSESLFPLVRCHFMAFSFLTARHVGYGFNLIFNESIICVTLDTTRLSSVWRSKDS